MMEQIIPQVVPEPIIARALRGDPDAVQRAIDLEIDGTGVYRGYAGAAAFWLRAGRILNEAK